MMREYLELLDIILRRDICNITLLGDIESIEQKSSALGLDLSKAKVIDPNSNLYTEQFVNKLYELRRDKGMVRAIAKDLIAKPNYFATMMVYFWICRWCSKWYKPYNKRNYKTCIRDY